LVLLSPRSTDNTTPKTLEFDEDTHDPETPVVLETPVVEDDPLHVDKKPCLDKDRDKKPGLEE